MRAPRSRRLPRSAALATLAALAAALLVAAPGSAKQAGPAPAGDSALYLVTIDDSVPTTASGLLPPGVRPTRRQIQDQVLRVVDSPEPVYRWTSALNGVAVQLTGEQAGVLANEPAVLRIERDSVRPLAGLPSQSAVGALAGPHAGDGGRRGGAGQVVGVIDTGLAPEGPVFSASGGLGPAPAFDGECMAGAGWDARWCDEKVVGASWFVAGFGADRIAASASLSPRDSNGHGTAMAALAAGNRDVSARVGRQDLGLFAGAAPGARLAIYKACWSAPDPRDDGCSAADLVTAIDRATHEGVDVISLSVGGPAEIDTVELALLGAAEHDIVVVGAAGNRGDRDFAAHPSPWVTTVGAATAPERHGQVVAADGPTLDGAMAASRPLAGRLTLASRVPAVGRRSSDARLCLPGSLDAARVAGTIVLCERGDVGRVDKSRAVALADGIGMVLTNTRRESVDADFHEVPTVHLDRRSGVELRTWATRQNSPEVTLRPDGTRRDASSVAHWSSSGDPNGPFVKPDLVAPATGVLSAVPRRDGRSWDLARGTSAATAQVAGAAAALRAEHPDWTAAEIRSALATSTTALTDTSPLIGGSGRLSAHEATRPGLVLPLGDGAYRRWLTGDQQDLNTPSVVLSTQRRSASRTLRNVTRRSEYFSSRARGFRGPVTVTPAGLRLAPGTTRRFTVRAENPTGKPDSGFIIWRGATGSVTRLPVTITR